MLVRIFWSKNNKIKEMNITLAKLPNQVLKIAMILAFIII